MHFPLFRRFICRVGGKTGLAFFNVMLDHIGGFALHDEIAFLDKDRFFAELSTEPI